MRALLFGVLVLLAGCVGREEIVYVDEDGNELAVDDGGRPILPPPAARPAAPAFAEPAFAEPAVHEDAGAGRTGGEGVAAEPAFDVRPVEPPPRDPACAEGSARTAPAAADGLGSPPAGAAESAPVRRRRRGPRIAPPIERSAPAAPRPPAPGAPVVDDDELGAPPAGRVGE